MNRGVDKRLSALEVKHDQRRKGSELLDRMPKDPRDRRAYVQSLTDAEIDELGRYLNALMDEQGTFQHDPALERFRVDLSTLSDEELEAYGDDLAAYTQEIWEKYG